MSTPTLLEPGLTVSEDTGSRIEREMPTSRLGLWSMRLRGLFQGNSKRLGWIAFTGFCFVFFTVMKLPQERIRNYVQSQLAPILSQAGMTLDGDAEFSIGFGIHYQLKNAILTLPPAHTMSGAVGPSEQVRFDRIRVTPRILPLFLGKRSVDLVLTQGSSELALSVAMRGNTVWLDFDADQLNPSKLGLQAFLSGLKMSGVITGRGHFEGDPSDLKTFTGSSHLNLKKGAIDQQDFMGFALPRINISEGRLDLEMASGRAKLNTLKLGKGPEDDLRADCSGEIALGKFFEASNLNLKVKFQISEKVMKSLVLLDTLLGAYKQPDGSYALNLSGPVSAPSFLSANPGG